VGIWQRGGLEALWRAGGGQHERRLECQNELPRLRAPASLDEDARGGVGKPFAGFLRSAGGALPAVSLRGGNKGRGSQESAGSTSLISTLPALAHSSLPEAESTVPVAHLSYTSSFSLAFVPGACINPAGPTPPQLFYSVHSIDSYGLQRAEGYACLDIPVVGKVQAGTFDHTLSCWSPAPADLASQEADFFLGGASRLSDITHARVPAQWTQAAARRPEPSAEDSVVERVLAAKTGLSRLGARTRTTGELGVRLNIIRQHAKPSPVSVASDRVLQPVRSALFSRPPKSVEEIIAEAKALRKKDRALGENSGNAQT
jgi:Ciliary basal body-associated, B9 protein